MTLEARRLSHSRIPNFPDFALVSAVSRDAYQSLLPVNEESSDFQWLSLRVWNPNARFCLLDGALVVAFNDYHDPSKSFLGFCGGNNPEVIARQLLDHCEPMGFDPALHLIPQSVSSQLSESNFIVEEDIDNHDYVYSLETTINAESASFRRYRRIRNGIERKYGPRIHVERLIPAEAYFGDMRSISDDWVNENGQTPFSLDEQDALNQFFEVITSEGGFESLIVTGLFLDLELVAFSADEVVSQNLALGHFGHASRKVSDASTYLHWKVAAILHEQGVKWLNDEQDLGHGGLRHHKNLNRPTRFVKKFIVRSKEI